MMIKIRPVILCGGLGARLWPLSRSGFPKQFLCLTGEEGIFQQATKWLTGLENTQIEVAAQLLVTGDEYRFMAPDASKAKQKLGGRPKTSFAELVVEMMREALKAAERDELIKRPGFKVMDYH